MELYGPLIERFMHSKGLQEADALDVAQEVLQSVARAIQQLDYNPQLGRFRSWLLTVAYNKLKTHVSQRQRRPIATGDSEIAFTLENQPDETPQSTEWDIAYERRLYEWAVEQVRPQFQSSTWQAFWLTAVDGKSNGEAAAILQITAGAVAIAKSRVTARLREFIQRIDEV